jgi:hypothetical protein
MMANDSVIMKAQAPFMNNSSGLMLGGVASSIDDGKNTNVRGLFHREIYGMDERAKKLRQQQEMKQELEKQMNEKKRVKEEEKVRVKQFEIEEGQRIAREVEEEKEKG